MKRGRTAKRFHKQLFSKTNLNGMMSYFERDPNQQQKILWYKVLCDKKKASTIQCNIFRPNSLTTSTIEEKIFFHENWIYSRKASPISFNPMDAQTLRKSKKNYPQIHIDIYTWLQTISIASPLLRMQERWTNAIKTIPIAILHSHSQPIIVPCVT